MALFTALRDNFNDNSLDASKWVSVPLGVSTLSEVNGGILCEPTSSPGGLHYASLRSVNTYDLTESHIFIEVADATNYADTETYFKVFNPSADQLISFIEQEGYLYFFYRNGTLLSETFAAYNSVSHRWWRIRHSSAKDFIFWDTSPDGVTWTNQRSINRPFPLTGWQAEFGAGTFDSIPISASATFDNVNYATTTVQETSTTTGGGDATLEYEGAVISEESTASGGGLATYISAFQALPQKDYEYRVSTHTGQYVATWQNVTSKFGYSQAINQNATELRVEIGRSPENRTVVYEQLLDDTSDPILDDDGDPILLSTETPNSVGPGTDVDLNYNVDVYAFYGGYDVLLDASGDQILDQNGDPIYSQFGYPNGRRVYSGYIADYELTYGQNTGVEVLIAPHATEMSHYVFMDAGNTTVEYNSADPVEMARDAVDNYNDQGGVIAYTTETMPLSGQVSSYDFKLQTTRESIDKTIDLLPAGYYHFVDPGENLQYLLQKSETPDHVFWYEQHIQELKLRKSLLQLVNKVYFVGGDTGSGDLFKYYEEATSISDYRPGLERMTDSRVTLTSSAGIISESKIDDLKEPRHRTSVTINDGVYDIEEIKLGHMISFKNFGTPVDNLLLQVVRLNREEHKVTLDLDMVVAGDSKRLEEIRRNQLSEAVRNIPDTPEP